MRVRYTLRAQADLEEIFRYLDEHSPERVQALRREVQRRMSLLGDFPMMGPATDEPGVHELALTQFPYKVYYELQENEIWVLHVRHMRRRPWVPRP